MNLKTLDMGRLSTAMLLPKSIRSFPKLERGARVHVPVEGIERGGGVVEAMARRGWAASLSVAFIDYAERTTVNGGDGDV